jgi:hypothetical protein
MKRNAPPSPESANSPLIPGLGAVLHDLDQQRYREIQVAQTVATLQDSRAHTPAT